MGDTVEFTNAKFRDGQWPKTLEDAVRLTASYAGAHDFDFQDEASDAFTDISAWTLTGCSGNVSSNDLLLTGTGSNVWGLARHNAAITPSFVASFDWTEGAGGFFFEGIGTDRRAFLFWIGPSAVGGGYLDASGSPTTLVRIPSTLATPARIQVAVRVDEERKWLEAGLFIDGWNYLAFAQDIGETALDWGGHNVGFSVYDTNQFRVDNYTVSELHRAVEWTLIDPGQPPGSGMSRAIGTTRVNYMCRYDNTIRVWRPGDRAVDWTPETGRIGRVDSRRSTGAPTHARVQAAIHEADNFEDDDGMVRMHRFMLHNDPNIMTEEEAYNEAGLVIHDNKERAEVSRLTLAPNYLIEPNDRVDYDGNSYRIVSVYSTIQMRGNRPVIGQQINAQKYLEQ
jgi:hypothetical protein